MVSTSTLIYFGHFLSSWGDRMWFFAIPLFLQDLESESLILTAAYGLTLACSVLIFGPLVGDWIDRRPRLYCARLSLIIQNSAVILCALVLLLEGDKKSGYTVFVKIAAIVLGAIAMLASTSASIIMQKDWIVVLAGDNQEMLARLNSTMRRIDLVTKILAPAACGQIMSLLSLSRGAIFIMCWNGASMFLEYFLLRVIYKRTPSLSKKREKIKLEHMEIARFSASGKEGNPEESPSVEINNEVEQEESSDDVRLLKSKCTTSVKVKSQSRDSKKCFVNDSSDVGNNNDDETKDGSVLLVRSGSQMSLKSVQKFSIRTVFRQMFGVFITLKNGWKLYISQPIALACIGFSFLYMTILGFGYITLAYAYSQCLSELTIGLLSGGAAITGIISTFAYPTMRKKIGLIETGISNALFQLSTLVPCIISIFVAGSPFYLLPQDQSNEANELGTTAVIMHSSSAATTLTTNSINTTQPLESQIFLKCQDGVNPPASFSSMIFFMSGVILGRIGLWGFDLVITQLIQESVAETERGIFNGVQSSLNNLMDLLSFVFVLALPSPSQFGFLVLISAVFVTTGYSLFFLYAYKVRRSGAPIIVTT